MFRGEYRFCLGESAGPVYRSLLAEVKTPSPEKGRVEVGLEGECLILKVYSSSLSGFRALTNSFLLLVHAAYSAIAGVERRG